AWNNRGALYCDALHEPDKAVADFSEAIRLDPKNAAIFANRGNAYRHLGSWDKAIADYSKAIALSPDNPNALNNLAWVLATCPDAKMRDSAQAVRLAKRSTELTPKSGMYWKTLGVAYYRVGDWQAARDALTKSMDLLKGGDSLHCFILAMAHRQQGNKEESRKWFDRAVQRMEKNEPKNEENRRFRAEAEELLEMKK